MNTGFREGLALGAGHGRRGGRGRAAAIPVTPARTSKRAHFGTVLVVLLMVALGYVATFWYITLPLPGVAVALAIWSRRRYG